jgi:hypothetical protein
VGHLLLSSSAETEQTGGSPRIPAAAVGRMLELDELGLESQRRSAFRLVR